MTIALPTAELERDERVLSAAAGEDPRIARTKHALRTSLISLIEEKGLEAVTVGDLCARANITRGTFYNHYRDKDELLHACEDQILADLTQFQRELGHLTLADLINLRITKRPLPLFVKLFDCLREQAPLLHAVLGPGGDASFGPKLRDAVCTELVMSVLNEHYRDNPTPFVKYYVAFYASAYLGIITRWIETGMQESSEEMARICMRMLFIRPGESIEL